MWRGSFVSAPQYSQTYGSVGWKGRQRCPVAVVIAPQVGQTRRSSLLSDTISSKVLSRR